MKKLIMIAMLVAIGNQVEASQDLGGLKASGKPPKTAIISRVEIPQYINYGVSISSINAKISSKKDQLNNIRPIVNATQPGIVTVKTTTYYNFSTSVPYVKVVPLSTGTSSKTPVNFYVKQSYSVGNGVSKIINRTNKANATITKNMIKATKTGPVTVETTTYYNFIAAPLNQVFRNPLIRNSSRITLPTYIDVKLSKADKKRFTITNNNNGSSTYVPTAQMGTVNVSLRYNKNINIKDKNIKDKNWQKFPVNITCEYGSCARYPMKIVRNKSTDCINFYFKLQENDVFSNPRIATLNVKKNTILGKQVGSGFIHNTKIPKGQEANRAYSKHYFEIVNSPKEKSTKRK
ncbi:MAG: hypothetical protein ACJAZS_000104 [Alteromonas naphthalenivorans]|jgi:hypothetical protein